MDVPGEAVVWFQSTYVIKSCLAFATRCEERVEKTKIIPVVPISAFREREIVGSNALGVFEDAAAAPLSTSRSADECLLPGKERRASAVLGDVVLSKRASFKLF